MARGEKRIVSDLDVSNRVAQLRGEGRRQEENRRRFERESRQIADIESEAAANAKKYGRR